MVFGSRRRPVWGGQSYLDWDGIIGVYSADEPEEACKAAARDSEAFGTYFAIPGVVWGVEILTPEATKLGDRKSTSEQATDKLTALLERMDKRDEQMARLLEQGEDEST